MTSFVPDWTSPPGDTLAALLEERGMTQTELAHRLGVSLKHVNRVIRGAASLSAELALGLEKVLGAPATFWMTREAHYQADKARHEERERLIHSADWAQQFPVKELRTRGLLPRQGEGADLVQHLLAFLGLAGPDQWTPPQVSYRKSQKFESDAFALASWLREGELEAEEIDCAPYDESRFLDALEQARSLTRLDPEEWWPKLQHLCATAGVAVVVVDTYPRARVNGATRWLSADKALIQLSLRYRWEDIFWFTFFHEAGHVVLHRKKDRFVEIKAHDIFIETPQSGASTDPVIKRLEDEANRFAARVLIPPPHDRRLRTLALQDVERFAERLDVAPAIVVGRMMHDGILPWSHGNDHRRRLEFVREPE